jgi:hypothetical protein
MGARRADRPLMAATGEGRARGFPWLLLGMRALLGVLVCACVVFSSLLIAVIGMAGPGAQIIIPDGYRGSFKIIGRDPKAPPVPRRNGKLIIPESGILRTPDDPPFSKWQATGPVSFTYQDGTPIPRAAAVDGVPAGTIAVWGPSGSSVMSPPVQRPDGVIEQHAMEQAEFTFLIGTQQESERWGGDPAAPLGGRPDERDPFE